MVSTLSTLRGKNGRHFGYAQMLCKPANDLLPRHVITCFVSLLLESFCKTLAVQR